MDWIAIFANSVFITSGVAFTLAAAFTCWRAGSFHPINARLLRFFISKDDIEDPVIRKDLADQAALASFRMTHGVRAQTLSDAKALLAFSEESNIPLYLVGRAGSAFDKKSLALTSSHGSAKKWLGVLIILSLPLFLTLIMLSAATASSRLLVTLKATDTWLWLGEKEAEIASPFSLENHEPLYVSSCNGDRIDESPATGFSRQETQILCDIWGDAELQAHLETEVRRQRITLILPIAFLLWCLYENFVAIRKWSSVTELRLLLADQATAVSKPLTPAADAPAASE